MCKMLSKILHSPRMLWIKQKQKAKRLESVGSNWDIVAFSHNGSRAVMTNRTPKGHAIKMTTNYHSLPLLPEKKHSGEMAKLFVQEDLWKCCI